MLEPTQGEAFGYLRHLIANSSVGDRSLSGRVRREQGGKQKKAASAYVRLCRPLYPLQYPQDVLDFISAYLCPHPLLFGYWTSQSEEVLNVITKND